MKNPWKILAISVFVLIIAAPAALAQTAESSTLVLDEPTDVGGTVLQPGTYNIRVVSRPVGDRNRVQITSLDGTQIFTTVLTVPHDLEPNEQVPASRFVYFPAGEGQPRALRTWFAPNSPMDAGHDIVYEESRAKQLARLASRTVVSYPEDTVIVEDNTPTLSTIRPDATVEAYTVTTTTPAPAPVTTTVTTPQPEVTPMTSAQPETDTQPVEMPRTASRIPLMALLGLVSIATAAVIRFASA
jgi:hypothetical protein